MASVNKINEAFATLRGVPIATIEAYSRVLRREGILPETRRGGAATPIRPLHCAYMLAAILRGSPSASADAATEIGGLIVHDGGALTEPVLTAKREVLGWAEDITFAQALAWMIDRYVDGTKDEFIRPDNTVTVEIDRYWASASITWHPTMPMVDALLRSHTQVFGEDMARRILDIGADGFPLRPMTIEFRDPLLFEMKASYRDGDTARNSNASRKFAEKKQEMEALDVWGTESVTGRTLEVLAGLLKDRTPKGQDRD